MFLNLGRHPPPKYSTLQWGSDTPSKIRDIIDLDGPNTHSHSILIELSWRWLLTIHTSTVSRHWGRTLVASVDWPGIERYTAAYWFPNSAVSCRCWKRLHSAIHSRNVYLGLKKDGNGIGSYTIVNLILNICAFNLVCCFACGCHIVK